MPATPLGKISRATAKRVLKAMREIQGTLIEPSGAPEPELASFIRGVRAFERPFVKKKIVLHVELRFDHSPLPKLVAADAYDFHEVLVNDGLLRLRSLGIEVLSNWTNTRWIAVYATAPKSRRKVEAMIDAWKRHHIRPGA